MTLCKQPEIYLCGINKWYQILNKIYIKNLQIIKKYIYIWKCWIYRGFKLCSVVIVKWELLFWRYLLCCWSLIVMVIWLLLLLPFEILKFVCLSQPPINQSSWMKREINPFFKKLQIKNFENWQNRRAWYKGIKRKCSTYLK